METRTNRQRIFFFDQALPSCLIPVGRHSVELMNWGRIAPHRWQNLAHSHSFYELCYISQGRGAYTFKGERRMIAKGDLVVAFPGEEHRLQSDSRDPMGIYCASFGIYPGQEPGAGRQEALSELIQRFKTTDRRVVRLQKFEGICRLISEEVLEQPRGYEVVLPGLFAKFLFDLLNAYCTGARAHEGVPAHRTHPEDMRLQKAVLYIENHFQDPLRVKDVAECLCVSTRQANRLFIQAFGMPVMRHVKDYRLRMAKQMLDNTSRPIKEIAWACGYPNERNFMTLFRRQMGMTARTFRHARTRVNTPPR